MGLFRRNRRSSSRPSPAAAIAQFWEWWPSARPLLEQAIGSREFQGLDAAVSTRVAAIDPDLNWELAPGRVAEYALVVSAGGQRRLRALAERWMRAGPGTDLWWEFHSARQPDPGALDNRALALDGYELDLSDVVLGLSVDGERAVVDVAVHHPLFPRMAERTRAMVTFLVLDWLLGEDGVECWIGGVEVAVEQPLDGVPAAALPGVVAQVADGVREPRWAVMSGETPEGQPVVATVRLPLKPAEFPLFDLHVGVAVPYAHANSGRLPVDPSLAALCELEDVLVDRLGDSAVFVGHESFGGARLLHFYADSEDSVPAQIHAMCRSWTDGQIDIDARLDGGWDRIQHLRV